MIQESFQFISAHGVKYFWWISQHQNWYFYANQRAKGFQVLPKRWVVERTFAWLNCLRRLSKDYETSCCSAETMIMISHTATLLKRLWTQTLMEINGWIASTSFLCGENYWKWNHQKKPFCYMVWQNGFCDVICLNFLDGSFYKRQCSTDCRCKLIMFAQLNLDISFRKKWQRCDFLFQEFQICFCEIWHKKSAQNHIAVYDRVDIPDSSC